MVTKRNLLALIVSAIITIIGGLLFWTGNKDFGLGMIGLGNYLAFIFGLIMLLAHSTIVGTIYWRIIFGTFIISNVLSIIQLFLNFDLSYVFLAVLSIYVIVYLIWFLKKPAIGHLDVLKLLWIISSTIIPILFFFKTLPVYLLYAAPIILWVLIIDFILIGIHRDNLIAKIPSSA